MVRRRLERGVADAADHGQIRPQTLEQRFIEALFKLPAQIRGARGHRLYFFLQRFPQGGLHLDGVADRALLDVVHDHLPVVPEVGELAHVHREEHREDKGHVLVRQGEAVDVVDVIPVVHIEEMLCGDGEDIRIKQAVLPCAHLGDVAAGKAVWQRFVGGGGEEHAAAGLIFFALPFELLRTQRQRPRPRIAHVGLERRARGGNVFWHAGGAGGAGIAEDLRGGEQLLFAVFHPLDLRREILVARNRHVLAKFLNGPDLAEPVGFAVFRIAVGLQYFSEQRLVLRHRRFGRAGEAFEAAVAFDYHDPHCHAVQKLM